MRDDDGGAGWQQHDSQHEAWLRHEIAKVCGECARCGGHPVEGARGLERILLAYACLDPLPERDEAQPDLFQHAA